MNIKLYKDVSKRFKDTLPEPLQEIKSEDVVIGDTCITSYGTRVRKISEQEFEIVKSTDLVNSDDMVEDLTPLQLKLFWNIMNYDTNKS